MPLEGSKLSPKVEIPRWSGPTKRVLPQPWSNRDGWIGFQNVSRGLERRDRERERGHLDDCVRWKGRGTGVRRGCVHGLTIGNQTPFNALPSLQRMGARSFFRIRRIPSIFRPAWVWVYRVRHVKPRNDSIFPETIAVRRSISFENCCITFEKFK